jgi:hypothetical protein
LTDDNVEDYKMKLGHTKALGRLYRDIPGIA